MSLACGNNLTASYLRGCDIGPSGIRTLYAGNYSRTTFTYDSTGTITGGTGYLSGGSTGQLYTYELKEETGSFNENVLASATGNISYEQLVEMVFLLNRQEVRNRVDELCSTTTFWMVEDEGGRFWAVGAERGCTPSAGVASRGVASTDENSFRVTFRTVAGEPAREISSAFAAGLII